MARKDLLPGEKIVKKTYISRIAKLYYYILGLVLIVAGLYSATFKLAFNLEWYFSLILILAGVFTLVVVELRRFYHKYIITDKRVIKESGILKSEVTAWELRQIINVRVYQSLFGRITGFGTIDIVLMGNNNLFLESVRHPEKVMEVIEELVETKR